MKTILNEIAVKLAFVLAVSVAAVLIDNSTVTLLAIIMAAIFLIGYDAIGGARQ